jgi:Na+/proline symporter
MFSTCTAELVAISSVVAVDLVEGRTKRPMTPRGRLRVARTAVAGAAALCALLLVGFEGTARLGPAGRQYLGATVGLIRAAAINSAIVPLSLSIYWRRSNVLGALGGMLAGTVAGTVVGLLSRPANLQPGAFLTAPETLLLVSATAVVSSGVIAVFGGVLFGHTPPSLVVSLPRYDRSSAHAWRLRAWPTFVVLGLVLLSGLLAVDRLPRPLFGAWIMGGLILLFLTTAYICLMPIKESFGTTPPPEPSAAFHPYCSLPRSREADEP